MSPVQAWQRGIEAGVSIGGSSGASLISMLTNPGAQSSPHGTAISTLTIAAGGHGQTLAYSAAGLPTGLSINGGTGAITGTPTTIGLWSPIVTVTEASSGVTESVQFDWNVT